MSTKMTADMSLPTLDRRDFIKASAASLVVPVVMSAASPAEAAVASPITAYLKIDTDNVTTVMIGATEMGQGIMTGLAQLVAEELQCDWRLVKVEHGVPLASGSPFRNPLFGMQLTGGSTSMRGWYTPLRQAAAEARARLLQAAANWNPALVPFTIAGSSKIRDKNGTLYPFSNFVVAAGQLASAPAASPVATTTFIGKKIQRTDIPEKVRGLAVFGIDVHLNGMVYASVVHCPTLGGTVATAPASISGALGVYNLGTAVAVVAEDSWLAMKLAKAAAAQTTWTLPADLTTRDSAAITATGQRLVADPAASVRVYETVGTDPAAAIAASAIKLDVTYTLPYLAHACMEVLNCTADVRADGCDLWAPTQAQDWCLSTAAAVTGLAASQITVHTTYLGGGLGRKIEQDFIKQALMISKLHGAPVKLTWSREQDFKNDMYRPCAAIRVQAGATSTGALNALLYRNVSPSINIQRNSTPGNNPEDTGAVAGAVGLPYAITNRKVEFVPNPADVPLGYWRSVGESYNTFAVESAIDELALAVKKDPLALRKSLLAADTRALGVINEVARISSWSSTTGWASVTPAGSARGMAFLKGFGSWIALVVEISLNTSGQIKVNKAFCAIDCGRVINPDAVEAQIQGGIAHGISAALWGQVTFVNGVPQVSNFSNYRMLRPSEMPAVTVSALASTAAPGGVGETGVPCVAPAIANAYAKLKNIRQRSLPFYPGATMSG